ncbi:MAG TPA: ATP-binding protein [Methyloceanibacter sp.]|jgi:signal transduction histidine kinase|nr:ATP-binding protein [Methyloceanibacter sp.]
MPLDAAFAADGGFALDPRTLLTLGIILGIIAFAVGIAYAYVRAAERARRADSTAAIEAERYRLSENMLETLLTAEPQALLTVTESGEAELLVASLPAALGVPRDTGALLHFAGWLDAQSVLDLEKAIDALAERGEPFNLMLRTRRERYVEVDGRATGRTILLKVRDLAGQRLDLADAAAKQRQLEEQVASLRALLDDANKAGRGRAETKPSPETRFRSFDRLATAFAVFDASQRLTHFNQAYVEFWQLDPDWLATHPRDGDILDRLRQARRLPEKADYREWKRSWLSRYGTNAQAEDQWHLPDGRALHVVADSEGEAGVTYLYENVTERLALESRYNALIEVQTETLDTLREGVAVFGPNGRLRLYNRAFATIWRLNPRQLDGEPHVEEVISWCRVLHDAPEEWDAIKAAVTAIVPARVAYEKEFDRADGSVLACAVLPLPDGGTLLTYVDVSDAKHAERALIEKNEALEAADRLKTAFISHVSYELRTPLTNIIGFSELLASPIVGTLTDRQRDYLNDIRFSGRTLLSIIDDILDLATIDAGTLELKLSPVKVREVIDQAAQGVQERLAQNRVTLDIEIEPGIDEFVADGRRVTQMLYNLLSNAIGFSDAGGKILLACGRENSMIAFTVTDQGIGIPADYQQAVFDRFESRSHGSSHRGAGLGLSIVKSLAELHGGTVTLDSAPGRGTWVKLLLPLEHELEEAVGRGEPRYKSSLAG